MKVLVLSDIHANWPALQGVLKAEADADQIICLGDIVGWGPQPAECVNWAMGLKGSGLIIQGNHDRAFGMRDDPRCTPVYQWLAEAVQAATIDLLTAGMKRFLAKLSPIQRIQLGAISCVAYHAIPSDPLYGYLSEQSGLTPWESEFIVAGHPDLLLLGHTHVPMKTQFQRTLVVNPGSVGQPKHGDARAAYAVWQEGRVTLRRLAYDVEETVRAFAALNLPDSARHRLAKELRTGRQAESAAVAAAAKTAGLSQ